MLDRLGVSARLLAPHEADALSVGFVEYWHRLAQGRRAPTRRDVDPLELRPWIGSVNLWEQLDDGDFRCRIWATQIAERVGANRNSLRASAIWPAPYGAMAFETFQQTMARREPTVHRVQITFQGESWTYDRVALPLASSPDTPPMLLNYAVLGDPLPWQRLRAALDEVAPAKWTHGAIIKPASPDQEHAAAESLLDERRLTARVLWHWRDMATRRRFPTMAELDPWLIGDDWASCALMRLKERLERSSFIVVGDRLAPDPDRVLDGASIVACLPHSVLGTLVKHLWRVEARPEPLMVEGTADHVGRPVLFRGVLLPLSQDGARMDMVFAAANWRERHVGERPLEGRVSYLRSSL